MSIKTKAIVVFIISLMATFILIFFMYKINSDKNRQLVIAKYKVVIKEIMPLIVDGNKKALSKKLKELDITTPTKTKSTTIYSIPLTFGKIDIKKDYTLHIKYLNDNYLFYDKNFNFINQEMRYIIIYGAINLLILLSVSIFMLRVSSSLIGISKNINLFGKGNQNIRLKGYNNKETLQIANSFNKMADTITKNIRERDEFIRYIGHELKTPLAKIEFAIEKGDLKTIKTSAKQIDEYIKKLLYLQFIKESNLKLQIFDVETLIVEALNSLQIKDESIIKVKIEPFKIQGDLDSLKTAVKNLIDNAIKYSTKPPVVIVAHENNLSISGKGEKIENFENCLIPFHYKSHRGHGLGLSIVSIVLKKHGFPLAYRHSNNTNSFTIIFLPDNSHKSRL